MRVAIVGAGAIGAYVGAALARGGSEVTLIARGPHLRAMQKHGVRVLSPRGDFEAHPTATDDLAAVADAEVVFVTLKAYSLPELASRLGAALSSGAALIAAQNGIPWWYFQSHGGALEGTVLDSVDPGGIISRSLPFEAVVGCVVFVSTEIIEPGVIRHIEGTRLTIGEPDGVISERCLRISEALKAGGLKTSVEERLRDQIWLKLVGNLAFNSVTALTGATLGELATQREMVDLLRRIFEESAEVAERLGIHFDVSLERRLQAGFEVGDHKTSMLQDLEASKPLEIDCLTGAVLELAALLEVPTPHTCAIHACVKLLDALTSSRAPTPSPEG
jgi:2-dehydropantoate 2-reductase